MGLAANPGALLNQPPIQAPPNQNQSTETSRQNPALGKRKERLAAIGLSEDTCKNLMHIRRELKESWHNQRVVKIRQTLKAIEYSKDNQFVVLDPFTNNYYNPLQGGASGIDTFSSQNLANLYQVAHNHIQFLDRVYVSVLKASIPRVQFWPDDAESDLDNRAAQTKSRAIRMIGRQNNESALLEQALRAFFYGGSYWRYTRWSMDERICKPTFIDKEEMQERTILPDRYTCPECGQDIPAQPGMQPQCQSCGAPLSSANFFPAQKMMMPVVTGKEQIPQGQVRASVYNCLHIDQMPQTPVDGNPIMNTPLLDLEAEIFVGALRGMYPDAWDLVKKGDTDSFPGGETSRVLRLRMYSPSQGRGSVMAGQLPTYHRTWFQPDAYDYLDKEADAKILHDNFPEGLCLATLGEEVLDGREAPMHKEWSWAGTRTDLGAYPPSRVQPAMPIQDEINDNENTVREYCDRAACGPILYNKKLVGEQLNNQHMKPGTMKGLTVQGGAASEVGFKLENAFFQFQAKLDPAIFKHSDGLKMAIQILLGITPQTYGGQQHDIQTAQGQEQALKVAMGVLWGDWDQIRQEFASAANIAMDCLAANATSDMFDVIEGEDSPGFKNETIPLADLAGSARAYPEADQGYPIGYEQQRELYRELLGMANGKAPNPLVMEMLDNYKNRRLVLRYVGDSDMVLPEQPARDKVLADITKLVDPEAEPVPGTNPMSGQPVELPSVMPDADFLKDFWDVAIGAVVEYGLNNAKLMETNPRQFENLRLYLKQCRFLQKVGQAQAALPAGGMPAGGPGEVAGESGGPSANPGAVAPPPVPPQPVGPSPMAIQ